MNALKPQLHKEGDLFRGLNEKVDDLIGETVSSRCNGKHYSIGEGEHLCVDSFEDLNWGVGVCVSLKIGHETGNVPF